MTVTRLILDVDTGIDDAMAIVYALSRPGIRLEACTTTFGNTAVPQMLRQLHKQSLQSHYWVRSSADGRYVGYGMNDSAAIVDSMRWEPSPASGGVARPPR